MSFTGVSHVILGILRLGRRSGYEIKSLVDNSTRFFWAASYGQIYPELRRLAKAGLIEGESAPRGGRRRTIYRLTPTGEAALHSWLVSPESTYELRDEGLLKLFFADALTTEETIELLRAIRSRHQAVVDRLRAIEPMAKKGANQFPYVVLQYGVGVHGWIVAWCEEMERRLLEEAKEGE